ncbi:MAG: Hsp20/alpha crystallin family protein [Polaromonas sp.]|nr:Hsp20/alpha crystallin family protein [Polaromonas sp.]
MFYALDTRSARPARSFQSTSPATTRNSALEQLLTDSFSSRGETSVARSATVKDLEYSYALELDVPGLAKEQLDIGIEGDVVRVSNKEDAARKVKAAWRFPLEIDVANSSAKLENGVLTLTLGKKVPVSNVASLSIS